MSIATGTTRESNNLSHMHAESNVKGKFAIAE